MKPRILATDLDGTLIPLDDHSQNERDLRTLARLLREQQVVLTYVTGRHLEIVLEAVKQHQLPPADWMICDVGTSLYGRTPDGWQPSVPYQEHLQSLTGDWSHGRLQESLTTWDGLTLQEEQKQGPYKLSFYADCNQLDDLSRRIQEWLTEQNVPWSLISSVDPFTDDGLIDLLPRGVSKAAAVQWWSDREGYDHAEVIFAGDSGNDLAALTAGYLSIVVANADRDLVKRVLAHHEENGWSNRCHFASAPATSGVLEGCRAFGLIPDE